MNDWQHEFRARLDRFRHRRHLEDGDVLSIKVRVGSGCFERPHSPAAYKIIDEYLSETWTDEADYAVEEHESGPEILLYLAAGTAVLTLSKSVIDLVTTILKARSEGIARGDKPNAPLEVIVRYFDADGKVREERCLRMSKDDAVNGREVERAIREGTAKLVGRPVEAEVPKEDPVRPPRKRGRRRR